MSLIAAIQTGESLYIAVIQTRAAIEMAEMRLAELKAQYAAGKADWDRFLAGHPALGPVVTERVAALDRAGLLDAVINDEPEATASASVEATRCPPRQPPVADAVKPRTGDPTTQPPNAAESRSSRGSPFAKRSAPVTVGRLDVTVPAKPRGSNSTKSQIGYKITWAANYQRGFDDGIEGKRRKLRPGEGPARDGYNRGRADAEAWKNNSITADAARENEPAAPEDNTVKTDLALGQSNPRHAGVGESVVLVENDQEITGLTATSAPVQPIELSGAPPDHVFSPENLEPFEVEITEFGEGDPSI